MALILNERGITSFLGLREFAKNGLKEIVLRDNALWSFENFGSHEQLRRLDLSGNRISSFLGMTKQRSLEDLTLVGNPVADLPHYRVMALLTIGFSLKIIDGKSVDRLEIERARQLGPSAALAVSCGWKLDLAPRDETEYQSLIAELRSERRALLSKHAAARVVTVIDAAESNSTVKPSATVAPAVDAKRDEDDGLLIHKRAVAHLSRRVALLEARAQQAEAEAQMLRSQRAVTEPVAASVSLHDDDRRGITPGEVLSVAALTFGPLKLESNLAFRQLCSSNAFVELQAKAIGIFTFFDRTKIFDRPFAALLQLTASLTRKSVQLVFADGACITLISDSDSQLSALWKTLHFLWRKAPPVILPYDLPIPELDAIPLRANHVECTLPNSTQVVAMPQMGSSDSARPIVSAPPMQPEPQNTSSSPPAPMEVNDSGRCKARSETTDATEEEDESSEERDEEEEDRVEESPGSSNAPIEDTHTVTPEPNVTDRESLGFNPIPSNDQNQTNNAPNNAPADEMNVAPVVSRFNAARFAIASSSDDESPLRTVQRRRDSDSDSDN